MRCERDWLCGASVGDGANLSVRLPQPRLPGGVSPLPGASQRTAWGVTKGYQPERAPRGLLWSVAMERPDSISSKGLMSAVFVL